MNVRALRMSLGTAAAVAVLALVSAGAGSARSLALPFCGSTPATRPAKVLLGAYYKKHPSQAKLVAEEKALQKKYHCQFGG
jgi:hypothetical protein